MITYTEEIKVFIDAKLIGTIHSVRGGFQYFPKGQKEGGEIFPTVSQVKASLEER